MPKKPPKSALVTVTGYSKKGNGFGFTLDAFQRRVEVPFTMPGDTATVALHGKKGGVYAARLEQVTAPSPDRIQPRCVHFGLCGGCRWQHLSYQQQQQVKQEVVETLFAPLLPAGRKIGSILPCTEPWAYRNKMEFSFAQDAAGQRYLGLIIDSSRGKVLNLSECHLVNPWFVQTLQAVRSWWSETALDAYHPYSNTGSLRTLILREGISSGDRLVMLTVSGNPDYRLSRQQIDSFTAFVRDAAESLQGNLSIFLRIQQAIKGQETNFYEMLLYGPDQIREQLTIQLAEGRPPLTLHFQISPSAFFQPNTKQAEKLYSTALQLVHIREDAVVYDLYCGTGTLGICAATIAKQVLGVEIAPEASLDARQNAQINHLDNIQILTGAVQDVIEKVRQGTEYPLPDIVMLDPPRAGLDQETLRHLIELQPGRILYISCNPATQAENAKVLIQAGYRIEAVQPVDQFPHTVHIENILVLSRP